MHHPSRPAHPTPSRPRWRAVLAVALLAPALALAGTGLGATAAALDARPAGAAVAVALTGDEQAHLDLINAHRRDRGLSPLVVDARAQLDARSWAASMAASGQVGHDGDLAQDCRRASSTCTGWAENVGAAGSHETVFRLFADSAGHAANMRRVRSANGEPYRVGIGVRTVGGTTYVVHRFYACACANDDLARRMNADRAVHLAFAQALHEDFLGRSASATQADATAAPLAYGVDRRRVARNLAYSQQWVGALVERFYLTTLGRSPDDEGRRFWTQVIQQGRAPAEVAAYFYASDEYYANVGGTDRAWVRDLYDVLLDRSPAEADLRWWVAVLGREPRPAVAVSFYQAEESRQRRVTGLYRHLLERDPDPDGLRWWTAQLADGHDVRLAVDLAGSGEYLARAVRLHG